MYLKDRRGCLCARIKQDAALYCLISYRIRRLRDRLHAYAFVALLEDAPEERYPAVAAHLARCTECRADLDELLEMTPPLPWA